VQPTQQTTDRRRLRGEQSKRAIIDAAIDCIASRGLRNTTLDAVAGRAKVSRALVVFHFKSKNKMHIDLLNYLGARFSTGWDAVLADQSGTPGERLLRLLEYDVRFASDYPKYLSVWYAFWGEAKGSTLYREVSFPRDQRYKKDVRALLQALVKEGGYDHIDLPALNRGIEAMLFGLWLDTHLYPGADHYAVGMRALGTYLSALFPRHFAAN
jgi:AcrR family transcriptional regulator